MITPIPIHFKKPGRSYSQIGRKGNVALYSVYSDYIPDLRVIHPYLLIGFELITIKIKNNQELYPSAWQFGKSAWSIPKSFSRFSRTRSRNRKSSRSKLCISKFTSVLNRSAFTEECAHLAHIESQADQTTEIPWENATNAPQRRVTLR